jgi:PAS domain S-box-containing protein
MVTALDDRASRLRGIQVGADGFMSKPFEHVELKTRVQTIVRLNRYRHLLEERGRSEAASREQEAQYRSLFDENKAVMLLLEPQSLQILDANPAACQFYGWSRDVLTQRTMEEIAVGPPDRFIEGIHRGDWPAYQQHRRAGGDLRQVEVYAGTLRRENVQQVYCIVHDVTERKLIEDQLSASREELRALALHLQSIREEERTRISREVHDELGQLLTGLKMDVAWLQAKLGVSDPVAARKAEKTTEIIDSAIRAVQRIASELRPGVLDNLGLHAAVEWQAEEFTERTGVPCALRSVDEDVAIERERATAVFRVFQEVLTNITRHARATRVAVRIAVAGADLVLVVRDNGIGLATATVNHPRSLGLVGIRERLHEFGGIVRFGGRPGLGTVVYVRLPLRSQT